MAELRLFALFAVIGLSFSLPCLAFENESDVLLNISLSLAKFHDGSCIKVLYSAHATNHQYQNTLRLFRKLASSIYKTCGLYTFQKYWEIRDEGQSKRSCFKPFKIVIGGPEARREFKMVR